MKPQKMDLVKHNQEAWNNYVDKKDRWTIPVGKKELDKARNGDWGIVLTPSIPIPHDWFPNMPKSKVLGLASGGGQQGPIMAALGADVTIFDNSDKQLGQDRKVSEAHQLNIKTVQGDMRDLSAFKEESFDLIFNPCSILFVDELQKVWEESYRVLKTGGILMTGLINPILFQLEKKGEFFSIIYKQPFSDLNSLPKERLKELLDNKDALSYGHSLEDQIGGILKAGFVLTDLFEDSWTGEELDEFLPLFIACRAMKIDKGKLNNKKC